MYMYECKERRMVICVKVCVMVFILCYIVSVTMSKCVNVARV